MNEDISFSAGPQPLWGSREWTVEIRMQSNRSSIVIFTHRDRAPEEKYANSIEDLVHLLIAFAEENDIPVFERKVVSFLSDYVTQAGLDIGFFDILDALRKQREAESRLLIEEDAHFQSGGLHPVKGTVDWFLEMKIKKTDIHSPSPAIQTRLTNTQSSETHEAMVQGIHEVAACYRDFIQKTGLAINERRLARTLSEYLTRLSLNVTFSEILSYLKSSAAVAAFEFKEEDPDEAITDLAITLSSEDTLPIVRKFGIGDLSTRTELQGILNRLLDNETPEEKLEIVTTSMYTISGKTNKTQSSSDATPGATFGTYSKTTTFENSLENPMVDIKITDILPFNLELSDCKTTFDSEPVKEKVTEGLVVSWSIPKLEPGQQFSVEYCLNRRISRVMVTKLGSYANTITTYHTIDGLGSISNQIFGSNIVYVNSTQKDLGESLVRDLLPSEFDIADASCRISEDEDINLRIERNPNDMTQVDWTIPNFPAGSTLSSEYRFRPHPYAALARGSIDLEGDDKLYFARILQPLGESNEWIITHSVELEGQISHNIQITETIPDDFAVQRSASSDPNYEQQTWEIQEQPRTLISSFICNPFERSTLSYRVRGQSDFDPQKEILVSLSDDKTFSFSSKFVIRSQSFLSPPPEHLELLRDNKNSGIKAESKVNDENQTRILTGIFPGESEQNNKKA